MMFRVAQASNSTLDQVRDMSVADYNDWCAFCIVEPRDGVTQATYFGEVIAALLNVNRDSSKRSEPFSAKDIFRAASEDIPSCYKTEEELHAEEEANNQIALMELLAIKKL
jgi:hypothetical protein